MKLIAMQPDNSPDGLFPDQTHEGCHLFGMPDHFIAAVWRHWVTGVALELAISNNADHINPILTTAELLNESMADFGMSAEVCLEDDQLQEICREVAAEIKVDLEQLLDVLNEGK
jgi:hypothetical protein